MTRTQRLSRTLQRHKPAPLTLFERLLQDNGFDLNAPDPPPGPVVDAKGRMYLPAFPVLTRAACLDRPS